MQMMMMQYTAADAHSLNAEKNSLSIPIMYRARFLALTLKSLEIQARYALVVPIN
jgi:hypothetical protein